MGILVPEFEFEPFGVMFPMAYIAISKNSVMLNPTAATGVFDVYTRYSVWSSYEARQQDKAAANTVMLQYPASTQTISEIYTLAYDQLKVMFPNYIDEQPVVDPPVVEDPPEDPVVDPPEP